MMPGVEEIHPQQVSPCIPMSSSQVYWTNQSWSPYVSLACPCSIDGRESVGPTKFIPPSHVQLSLLSFLTVSWVAFVLPSNRKHWLNMSFGVPIGSVWKCGSRRGAMAVAKRRDCEFSAVEEQSKAAGRMFQALLQVHLQLMSWSKKELWTPQWLITRYYENDLSFKAFTNC